jgi:hypothetical protein
MIEGKTYIFKYVPPWYKKIYYYIKVFIIGEKDLYINVNNLGSRIIRKGRRGILGKLGKPLPWR